MTIALFTFTHFAKRSLKNEKITNRKKGCYSFLISFWFSNNWDLFSVFVLIWSTLYLSTTLRFLLLYIIWIYLDKSEYYFSKWHNKHYIECQYIFSFLRNFLLRCNDFVNASEIREYLWHIIMLCKCLVMVIFKSLMFPLMARDYFILFFTP